MEVLHVFFLVLLSLIFFGVATVCFFLWINRKHSQFEEASYQQGFDHHKPISHRYRHADPTVDADPIESLKRYKVVSNNEQKIETKRR